MIPAILKIRFHANEILVSLMLVYVAFNVLAEMVTGPLRNPDGFNWPESRHFQDYPSAHNAELLSGTGIHFGVIAMFALVVLCFLVLRNHIFGFQVRLAGQSQRAARFAGIDAALLTAMCLGLSGALAGMAGLFEVAGPAGKLSTNFPLGYGFTAIIVAFLGRLHPVGILLAGLLIGTDLYRRGAGPVHAEHSRSRGSGFPGYAAFLSSGCRHPGQLPNPVEASVR